MATERPASDSDDPQQALRVRARRTGHMRPTGPGRVMKFICAPGSQVSLARGRVAMRTVCTGTAMAPVGIQQRARRAGRGIRQARAPVADTVYSLPVRRQVSLRAVVFQTAETGTRQWQRDGSVRFSMRDYGPGVPGGQVSRGGGRIPAAEWNRPAPLSAFSRRHHRP